MKNIFWFVLSICMMHSAFAANTELPRKLFIQVTLNHQETNARGLMENYEIKSTLKTSTKNYHWTAIQNKLHAKSNKLIVLSKIEKANAKEVIMRFLVLNTEIKPSIISAPKIAMLYGQKAQITIDDAKQKTQLTVLATPK